MDPRSTEGLMQVLLEDDDIEVLRTVGPPIGYFKDPGTVPRLIEALSRDTGRLSAPYVRLAAAEALQEIGDPRAVPALLKAMKDPFYEVRTAAMDALARMNERSAVDMTIDALKDPNWLVRVRAAMALPCFNDPRVLKALEKALESEEHMNVKANIVDAIARVKENKEA